MFKFIVSYCNFYEYSAQICVKAVQYANCQSFDVCYLLMEDWISERGNTFSGSMSIIDGEEGYLPTNSVMYFLFPCLFDSLKCS